MQRFARMLPSAALYFILFAESNRQLPFSYAFSTYNNFHMRLTVDIPPPYGGHVVELRDIIREICFQLCFSKECFGY